MSWLKTGGLSVGYLTATKCYLGTFVPASGNVVLFRMKDTHIDLPINAEGTFVSRGDVVSAMLARGGHIDNPNILDLEGLFTFVDDQGETIQRVPDARFYLGIENLVEYHPVTRDFSAEQKSRLINGVKAARG